MSKLIFFLAEPFVQCVVGLDVEWCDLVFIVEI